MRVQHDGRRVTVTVAADGDDQTVNHAGAALLVETADRLGLTRALAAELAGLRRRRAGHDPGRVIRDLAVMLADGGDALCDLRGLRDQPVLFGPVASDSTAWRVIDAVAEVGLLDAVRAARATARARAFELGARPAGPLIIDIDATLITAHSDKDGTGGTYKGGFGFSALLAYLDCPDGEAGGQPLAGRLRPGNAGANDARDHIAVLADALEQLPREVVEIETIVMRTDSAGLTHELLDFCRDGRIGFSVGYDLTEPVRRAILALPETAWTAALDADGNPRENGQVAELTARLELTGWPEGARVIVPRASAPRRTALVHRSRRAPLPGHPHRSARSRDRRARAPTPCPRAGRGPHPRRQRLRPDQPPVPRLRRQRRLARTRPHRPRPALHDPDDRVDRRTRPLRAQTTALPATAHRRTTRLPRPQGRPAPPSHLALGRRTRRRVRPPRRAAHPLTAAGIPRRRSRRTDHRQPARNRPPPPAQPTRSARCGPRQPTHRHADSPKLTTRLITALPCRFLHDPG